ncbi:MAG: ATP-binding protein [Candidatus Brocadiia bacterium]
MKLIIARGPNKGSLFDVPDERCTIGRAHSNRVVLYDRRVSAHHAAVEPQDSGYEIRDLGSSNGTYVNGLLITRSRLRPGDAIQLGDTVLAFERLPQQEAEPPSFEVVRDAPEQSSTIRATVKQKDSSTIVGARRKKVDVDALREDRRKLLALYRVNSAINSVRETHEMLCRVLEEIFDVLNAERGFVMLLDQETGALLPAAMRRRRAEDDAPQVTISRTIARQVIEQGEAVLSADAAHDERFAASESIVAHGIRSAMCAPLHGRASLQGIIYLDNVGSAHSFTPRDLRLLTAMANQVGIAVESSRLVEARVAGERYAAIGQAVAGLSHYIKNILGCTQGGAAIVQRGLATSDLEAVQRGWEIVRRNEAKISELVLDMLNYSGAAEPLTRPSQVNDIVRETAEDVAPQAEKEVRVECDLAPHLPEARVDPNAVHRCLLNLVSNAIDALPDAGGVVRLATRYDRDEQAVRIAVTDNGCGIEPELIPTLFNVFVSTKGSKGTGLGLAVVDKLVKEHGGRVEVASSPGEGSAFTLVLPLEPESDVSETARPAAPPS